MWKASAGQNVKSSAPSPADDDWETDSDFVNNVSEKEQRWGSKSVEGSGKPTQALNMNELRNNITNKNEEATKKEYQEKPGFSYGYGGKFGVQTDRMDKSAVGFDAMTAPSASHSSIPKYERPAVAVKPTDIKKNLEAASNSSVTFQKVEEARKQRADKDKIDRERIAKEQESIRSKELAQAKDEAERKKIAENQARARAQEEEAKRRAEEEDRKAAEDARRKIEELKLREAQAQAQAQAPAQVPEPEPKPSNDAELISATALFEYEASGEDEISFNEGDVITNIEMIDEGWWRGECQGRYGLFPANYVQRN